MDIQEAKKIIEKGIKPEYEILRQYDDYRYTGGWLEAIQTILSELDKKDKIISAMAEELVNGIYKFKSKKQVIDHFTNKYEEGE